MKGKYKSLVAGILIVIVGATIVTGLTGCEWDSSGSKLDTERTIKAGNNLQTNQPTPTDIDYSLERYNLIRRTYWVNGQREKANTLPCEVEKPLGYIVLFSGNAVVGSYVVDGKVSSLNSFLTPDSEYYEKGNSYNDWLPDVDGSYGANDNGIFFFTPDGHYYEWNQGYLYSDEPFEVKDPIVKVKDDKDE